MIHLILGEFHSRDDSGMERLLGLLVHLVIKLIHSWNDHSDTGRILRKEYSSLLVLLPPIHIQHVSDITIDEQTTTYTEHTDEV